MKSRWIEILFWLAGVYDVLIGGAFLFFGGYIFRVARVTPPNHIGYIQFPALLLIIFGIIFFRIAADPVKNREMILYGIALKVSYCGVTFWHKLHDGIPAMWLPWAWADIVFLILFIIAWKQLAGRSRYPL